MSRCLLRSPVTFGSSILATSASLAGPTGVTPLSTQYRYKAQRIKIANRKKVEMFVGTRFHLPTRLRTAAPDIAAEWDYERNPGHEYPEIIGIGHMAPVWWRCGQCGHCYQMSVEKRVVRGGGCEKCASAAHEEAERAARLSLSPTRTTTVREGGDAGDAAEQEGSAVEHNKVLPVEELLAGEIDPAMRSKRSTVLNVRTKY